MKWSKYLYLQHNFEKKGAGEGNRTLVFSLEVSGFSQCFQDLFRHSAAFWSIEITTEFLFVGMAGLRIYPIRPG
jgi:hypothetical protein